MAQARYDSTMTPNICNEVVCGNLTYATPRQLASLLGGPWRLIWRDREGDMDWCLCVVDLSQTLDRAGLKWKQQRDPKIYFVEL